jgi:pyrroloquinoline quinone biosynthesis protein B
MTKVRVLGAAAGGGFPQWNCACAMCAGLREGRLRARPRTQSSIALSPDGRKWILVNASPDIGEQLRARPALHPQHGPRHAPINAVVLTDGQIDHTAGLLGLREGPPIELYATPGVFEDLTTGLPILPALQHYCGVHWHLLPVAGQQRQTGFRIEGFETLEFEAVAVTGRPPPYSSRRHAPSVGDHIALRVRDTRSGRRFYYAPGLARLSPEDLDAMRDADCLLVDGSFWAEDDLIAAGLGSKRAADLGHLPLSGGPAGSAGMIELLGELPARQKVLTHLHNCNPVLDEDSCEHRELERHAIEVAYDGMEINF